VTTLLARVPVRADGRYCDKRCQFYWLDSYAERPMCELPKLLPRASCVVLSTLDGRALRCAQCVRACKEQP